MTLKPLTWKKLAILVVILFLLVSGVGLIFAQGDNRQLTPETPVVASLGSETFVQTFWFEGVAGQTVTLFASTPDAELTLALFLTDAEGNLLIQDIDPLTPEIAGIGDYLLETDGRYYVTVMRLSGAEGEGEGSFSLRMELVGGQADATVSVDLTSVPTEATLDATPEATAEPTIAETATPLAATSTLVTLDAGMQVSVTWNSTSDLDLEVRDPVGNNIYWENPTAANGVFDRNVNANCENTTAEAPTEQINWTPGASASGSYEIIVYYVQGCDNNAPAIVTVNAMVNGVSLEPAVGTILPDQVFLSSFVLLPDGEVTQGVSSIDPGFFTSDVSTFLAGQTPILPEASVTGEIDAEVPYQIYSFTGSIGQIVSVRMDAISGSLDPKLFLLDSTGNIVARNDDAVPGENVNAEIAGHTLVSDGLYTVVATRYGQEFGGTEGAFTLTLSGGEAALPPALVGLDLSAGSIEITLLWNTNADLQLLVRDPSGAAVYDDIPVVNSGGRLEQDGNVNCADTTTTPISYVFWPSDRLPPGTYEVEVWYQNTCDDTSPVTFNLGVRVGDQTILSHTDQPEENQVYLTNFTVDVNGFASVGTGGFISDSSILDIGSALLNAIEVSYGDTVTGTINQTNKFVLYTFDGEAGDQVRIGMQATAGTLDTTLFLLSPEGAQLAANDDAVVNETTNSLIDAFNLPADGTYIIVATHYGLLYGGTSGTYNLSLVRLN